jgi:hypothetical protein
VFVGKHEQNVTERIAFARRLAHVHRAAFLRHLEAGARQIVGIQRQLWQHLFLDDRHRHVPCRIEQQIFDLV